MARLPQGVRKREDGRLEKRFQIKGKRYSVYGTTVKEIQKAELELRKSIEEGTYTKNNNVTLDKYFEEWIKVKESQVKESTIRNYRIYYNTHISPVLGRKKIKSIERREINAMLDLAKEQLSPTSCNNVVRIIKGILKEAVIDDIITKSPAEGVKMLKASQKAVDTYHRALSIEEQTAFMQELKGSFFYEYFALMLSTGMRSGEVSALTWNDIDYKENVIHITKTVTRAGSTFQIGDTPKSDAGRRDIPMTASVRSILADQKAKCSKISIPMGGSLVFPSAFGNIMHNSSINRCIDVTLKSLEDKGIHIEPFTSHAMRDTFATRYIEQGGTPQTLKTILGHSSLSITMDLYSHVLPNTKQSEMDRIQIAI